MSEIIYFDTSALAKWYLNEARSEDVERYIQDHGPVVISDLTMVEVRCLLARRRREGSMDAKMEMEVFAFQTELLKSWGLQSKQVRMGPGSFEYDLVPLYLIDK